MAIQSVNLGNAPTGAGGDTFRSGSAKLQANDNEIYNYLGDGTNLNKLGAAAFKNVGTNTSDVMGVGSFGIGMNQADAPNTINLSSLLSPTGFGWFQPNDAWNPVAGQFLSGINVRGGGVVAGQLLIKAYQSPPKAYIRTQSDQTTWSVCAELYSTENTTTDANGFIKKASPIIKLFASRVDLNTEAAEQEIIFEKLGSGNYLIKGSSGLAQEGWYVETPKDANGNVLFSVIYETLENGDISVKTYKKKFDLETASIVADLDSPVDITEGRWIDVRLQELPKPEIKIPESATPPDFQPTGLAQAVAAAMESYNDPK